jgi:hypothetical protein
LPRLTKVSWRKQEFRTGPPSINSIGRDGRLCFRRTKSVSLTLSAEVSAPQTPFARTRKSAARRAIAAKLRTPNAMEGRVISLHGLAFAATAVIAAAVAVLGTSAAVVPAPAAAAAAVRIGAVRVVLGIVRTGGRTAATSRAGVRPAIGAFSARVYGIVIAARGVARGIANRIKVARATALRVHRALNKSPDLCEKAWLAPLSRPAIHRRLSRPQFGSGRIPSKKPAKRRLPAETNVVLRTCLAFQCATYPLPKSGPAAQPVATSSDVRMNILLRDMRMTLSLSEDSIRDPDSTPCGGAANAPRRAST